jgi:hypothetical protein
MRAGDINFRHVHPDAKISGVYYLSVPPLPPGSAVEEGAIMFVDPRPRAHMNRVPLQSRCRGCLFYLRIPSLAINQHSKSNMQLPPTLCRLDQKPAARPVDGRHEGRQGVPTEAIPDAAV